MVEDAWAHQVPKSAANHPERILALRRLTIQQKFDMTMELSEFVRQLFRQGLRERFPDMPEEEFHQLYLDRLAKCHNRNY